MPTEGSESQTRKPPLAGGVHAQVVPSLLGLGQILLRPLVGDDVCASAPYLSTKNWSAATTLSSAVFDRYGTGPLSFGATFWNPGVKTEKTAKKREKTGQKWARYGLRKRVRAALL